MENNNDGHDMVRVTIKSSDGQIFGVEKEVAMQWKVIKEMIDYVGEDQLRQQVIPVNVSTQTLQKVIEYCEYHRLNSSKKAWDLNFVSNVDNTTLLHLMKAADYLNVESLLNLTLQELVREPLPEKMIVEEGRGLKCE